jgi:lysophospholipase L1-like esterase
MLVVFMGDSITFGQYVDPQLRWTSLITNLIAPVQTLNHGVSGETTRQALERFPADVQRHHPDLLTLQFGLNDCNCWESDGGLPRVSEAAYRANLIEMIERARTGHVILSTNHPTLSPKVAARWRRYNDHVREVAELTGVELCDIEEGFAHLNNPELIEMLLPDLLHLSVRGHQLYADCIYPHVRAAVS